MKNKQPKCIAHYTADEYVGALWCVGDIYVYGTFRAHGHGEFALSARHKNKKRWTDLEDGMNYDFGRACDKMMQQMMQKIQPKDKYASALLLQIMKAWCPDIKEHDPLEFMNFLMDVMFDPYTEEDGIQILDCSPEHKRAIAFITKDYKDGIIECRPM